MSNPGWDSHESALMTSVFIHFTTLGSWVGHFGQQENSTYIIIQQDKTLLYFIIQQDKTLLYIIIQQDKTLLYFIIQQDKTLLYFIISTRILCFEVKWILSNQEMNDIGNQCHPK